MCYSGAWSVWRLRTEIPHHVRLIAIQRGRERTTDFDSLRGSLDLLRDGLQRYAEEVLYHVVLPVAQDDPTPTLRDIQRILEKHGYESIEHSQQVVHESSFIDPEQTRILRLDDDKQQNKK